MEPAQNFMEAYLREKAHLVLTQHRLTSDFDMKFLTPAYLALHSEIRDFRARNPETLVSIEQSDDTAKAITTGPFGKQTKNYRYLLRFSAGKWQISELEWECFACRGRGSRGATSCHICGGSGWRDPLKGGD